MVQWLGLSASTEGGPDSIPGQETKILQATGPGQKKKKRKKKISPYLPEVSGGKGHLSQGPGVPEPSALLYTPLPRLQFLYVPG